MDLIKEIGYDADVIRNNPDPFANLQAGDVTGQLAVLLTQTDNTCIGAAHHFTKIAQPKCIAGQCLGPGIDDRTSGGRMADDC